MKIKFSKYHGAGNDFVLIDDRNGDNRLSAKQIALICDRRVGVGADGLMLLQSSAKADFRMLYYNSDGHTASMCGNGGRCITAFARRLGIIGDETCFEAGDDMHFARIIHWDGLSGVVKLDMNIVEPPQPRLDGFFANTGVPHYVQQVADIADYDVFTNGRALRNHPAFAPDGANVNFIGTDSEGRLFVRTYERGVEGETLSCGTGVTAAALVWAIMCGGDMCHVPVHTLGGDFEVGWQKSGKTVDSVYLQGPATFVFDGEGDF
ncbi:MAG: diaminopimelate epimerase [Bacteroidales bacterium]|nr:diaminopimelate epimerase [Bacteroidales bacterium]